jgi:hypothetical protein
VESRIRLIPLFSRFSHNLAFYPTREDRKREGLVALVEADMQLFGSIVFLASSAT